MSRRQRIPVENVLNMLVNAPAITDVKDGFYPIQQLLGPIAADIGGMIVQFPPIISGNLNTKVDVEVVSSRNCFPQETKRTTIYDTGTTTLTTTRYRHSAK